MTNTPRLHAKTCVCCVYDRSVLATRCQKQFKKQPYAKNKFASRFYGCSHMHHLSGVPTDREPAGRLSSSEAGLLPLVAASPKGVACGMAAPKGSFGPSGNGGAFGQPAPPVCTTDRCSQPDVMPDSHRGSTVALMCITCPASPRTGDQQGASLQQAGRDRGDAQTRSWNPSDADRHAVSLKYLLVFSPPTRYGWLDNYRSER